MKTAPKIASTPATLALGIAMAGSATPAHAVVSGFSILNRADGSA